MSRKATESSTNRRRKRTEAEVITSDHRTFSYSDRKLLAITSVVVIIAGVLHNSHGSAVLAFIASAAALAAMASLVGRSVEALGDRLGAGATGVLQSFLGNLPEFFVILFSLKAGLYEVVKATLVGSILANVLLIMGAAFVVGGLKHGEQKFSASAGRNLGLLLLLSVFALAIPSATAALHTPASEHERAVSVVISLVLIGLFGLSLPDTLRRKNHESPVSGSPEAIEAAGVADHHGEWSLGLAIGMLAVAGLGAAAVSEWFVSALSPAIETMGISEAFAGLIIVAIAGNAVENVVGIQLAAKNQMEYAIQVIMQSPVQIAMTVAPVVALAAPLVGAASFTLVLSPLLLATLFMAAIIAVVIVMDGESTWFEGAALLALYIGVAVAFWWG